MTEIVDFAAKKQEREPHLGGKAVCVGCGYTWWGVAPIGEVTLPCPECKTNKGRFLECVADDGLHWTCSCGCQLFSITPKRTYCANCGDTIQGF